MPALEQINLAIVGSCGRGGSFKRSCEAMEVVRVHAVCDLNQEGLEKSKQDLGAEEAYTDFEEMLGRSKLDAVILGTPMPLHVPQAIAALRRGVSVISEVPAGVSVEECRDLVRAAKAAPRGAIYMMAENYTYMQSNQVIKEMVRRGEFGVPYYAEGEYIHELKGLNEITKWRRRWQTGVNGITYGTHSLGPILQWMPGDRVEAVCCAGGGRRHRDPRGAFYENEASCVMLCKTKNGALIKIRVDMLSDRPHSMTNYQLQGTDGCYESARSYGMGEKNRVWLRSKMASPDAWTDLEDIQREYMPESWVRFEELAKKAGHGGGDLLELIDFVDAIQGKTPTPIGIHEAMDMTLPGLVSQQSISQGGAWLPVPDSRAW